MYVCKDCNEKIEHLNYQFWLCDNCIKVIEIPVTKNWKSTIKPKEDNRFYDYKMLKHEIRNNEESINIYLEEIPYIMGGD